MNRFGTRRRRLQPAVILKIIASRIITQISLRAAQLEARLQGAALPSIYIDIAAAQAFTALGLELNHPRGVIAILSRQRSFQQRDALREAGAKALREPAADPLGQFDTVDPVLDLCVLAPDVKCAE